MSDKQSSHPFVWGFLAGAVATAVYTLLKTPRSGHETIEQIKGQGSKLKTRAEEKIGDLRGHGGESSGGWQYAAPSGPQYWQADVQDVAQEAQSAVEDVAQEVQEQAAEAVRTVQAEASEAAETVQAEFSDGAEAVQAEIDDAVDAVKETLES